MGTDNCAVFVQVASSGPAVMAQYWADFHSGAGASARRLGQHRVPILGQQSLQSGWLDDVTNYRSPTCQTDETRNYCFSHSTYVKQ